MAVSSAEPLVVPLGGEAELTPWGLTTKHTRAGRQLLITAWLKDAWT